MEKIFKSNAASKHAYRQVSPNDEATGESGVRLVYTKRSNGLLYACVFLLALGWAATSFYFYKTRFEVNGPLHVYSNTPIPKEVFNPIKKVFVQDPKYVGWSDEVNNNWNKLVAGHDAVWIENPAQYGLGPGEVTPYDHPNMPDPKPNDFYVISTLHSLHCLNMIRFQFYQEKYQLNTKEKEDPDYPHHFWKVHVEHCFEYLRQSISCGGDLILEGDSAIRIDGGQVTSVTGWGVEHDCIDFELLLQFQIDQEAKYNLTWQYPQGLAAA